MAEGWWHLAKDRNSGEAAAGADEIRAGAVSVTVGHTTYEVVTESVQSATVD